MTNNNDLLNGKVYKRDSSDVYNYMLLSCFIHIGATQSHRKVYVTVRSSYVLMIELNKLESRTVMIHTQVHLRIPCYDFYFL